MGHEILEPTFRREDTRGRFVEVLNTGHWEALICGEMNKDAVIGNHYHKRTEVFFFLKRGKVRVATVHVETDDRDLFELEENQGVRLRPNESHAIYFLDDSEFIMLKSIPHNPAEPDTFSYPVEDPG